MPTSYIHRLTLVIPATLQASINTWITANIDPTGGSWFVNGLSASGTTPATYYWTNAALTDSQCLSIVEKICQLASITPPSTWSSMTQAQKQAYVASIVVAVQAAVGIYILLDNNTSVWTPPTTVLATLSLQVIPSGSV
jgi:hypothetical protein